MLVNQTGFLITHPLNCLHSPTLEVTYLQTPSTSEISLVEKRKEFFNAIQNKFHQNTPPLLALKKVTELASGEAHPLMHQACLKEDGYIQRLFSSESWEEWCESRTALGQILHLYSNFVTGDIRISVFTKCMDSSLINQANIEAKALITKNITPTPPSTSIFSTLQTLWKKFDSAFSFPTAEALNPALLDQIRGTIEILGDIELTDDMLGRIIEDKTGIEPFKLQIMDLINILSTINNPTEFYA